MKWTIEELSVANLYPAYALLTLDPVQKAILRIAMRTFRSSPKVSLEEDANVIPLSLRREWIMCSTFLRHQTLAT